MRVGAWTLLIVAKSAIISSHMHGDPPAVREGLMWLRVTMVESFQGHVSNPSTQNDNSGLG